MFQLKNKKRQNLKYHKLEFELFKIENRIDRSIERFLISIIYSRENF